MSPDQPATPGKSLMRDTLRLGSAGLAIVAILDLAHESLSGGAVPSLLGLRQAYLATLAAYDAASKAIN